MAIWVVDVQFSMLVEADSFNGASKVARDNAGESLLESQAPSDVLFYPEQITQITDMREKDRTEWPWGRDDEMTCEQILDASKRAEQERQVIDGEQDTSVYSCI